MVLGIIIGLIVGGGIGVSATYIYKSRSKLAKQVQADASKVGQAAGQVK